jgi:hypothetical protein
MFVFKQVSWVSARLILHARLTGRWSFLLSARIEQLAYQVQADVGSEEIA